MIEGWTTRTSNVHLSFGSWFHEGCEKYERAKASGLGHQQALRVAIRHALTASWDKALGRPWNSENKDKNRYTLIRTLVWYLDAAANNNNSSTVILANGQPAVELTFKYTPTDYESGDELMAISGEPITFSGHLDSMVNIQDSIFISDRKTTSRSLGAYYFQGYSPDNQFSFYSHAGKFAYNLDISGVICDAVQVNATISKFERQVIYRSEAQLREWYADTKYYIGLMGLMAQQNRWPMNDKACFMCAYRPVCARTPSARQTWLETEYVKETWDPSIARGE
jgi:hypothetical protein